MFPSLLSFLWDEARMHPYYVTVELLFAAFVIFYVLPQRSYKPKKHETLTQKEVDELCEEWHPEPLCPNETSPQEELDDEVAILNSSAGPTAIINGKEVLNMSTFNFLGFAQDDEIQEACKKAILKYGVGACGPRGFYGTIDVHLDLEKRISEVMGTEEAIVYSYGFQTIASAIPAFSKIGDVLVVDEGVNFPIQTGCNLSRSTIVWFKHNNMADLEDKLRRVVQTASGQKRKKQRVYIVIEGLYQNYGDIAPLDKIVQLKNQYKFRLIMDDSFGFGVLGQTGRGTLEHFNIPLTEIDILCAALGNSIASEGGFCVGENQVVDHQRLSGAGYCFSASLPPFLARASIEAINKMQQHPEILAQLRENADFMRAELASLDKRVRIDSCPNSPILHLRLVRPHTDRIVNDTTLQNIVRKAWEAGLGLVRSKYSKHEHLLPESSIRLTVMATHTREQLSRAAQILKQVIPAVLGPEN